MQDATDEDIAEHWEERSAMREYEGGASRQFAEARAALDMRKIYGRVPMVVVERMRETEG
jgi:hypothetical protein